MVLAVTSWQIRETAMALYAYPIYPFKIAMAIGASIAAAEFARQLIWIVVDIAQGNIREDVPSGTQN
jgi:hypothetical protein